MTNTQSKPQKSLKSLFATKPKSNGDATDNASTTKNMVAQFARVTFGVFAIAVSFVAYIQILPIMVLLTAGLIGLPEKVPYLHVDFYVWIVASLGIVSVVSVFIIRWIQYLVHRLLLGRKA